MISADALNTLSRLKGIETSLTPPYPKCDRFSLNTLSRLKGIETVLSEPVDTIHVRKVIL